MGTQMVIERDQSEFLRLQQLGSILGLDIMQTATVHQDLSEQAFRQQVSQIFADGKISKEKTEQVKKLQEQFGLPDELAKKVIKGITSAGLIKNIEAEIAKVRQTSFLLLFSPLHMSRAFGRIMVDFASCAGEDDDRQRGQFTGCRGRR